MIFREILWSPLSYKGLYKWEENFSLDLKAELFAFLFPSARIPLVLIIFISVMFMLLKVK